MCVCSMDCAAYRVSGVPVRLVFHSVRLNDASIDYQGRQVDRKQFDAAEKAQETAMDKVNRSVQKIIRGLHLA